MSFGGNFARSLKETYMRTKQNNRIIDTLEAFLRGNKKQKKIKACKKLATGTRGIGKSGEATKRISKFTSNPWCFIRFGHRR
jgi:hypothetical protein